MTTRTMTESEFFNWHDRFKAAGGWIYRCIQVTNRHGRFYQVTISG